MQFACICVKTCKFSNLYIVCEHSVIMPRNKEANKQDGARQSPGIILQCQRCSHQWTYTGRNPYFTLCTYCKTTVLEESLMKKLKIDDQTIWFEQIAQENGILLKIIKRLI